MSSQTNGKSSSSKDPDAAEFKKAMATGAIKEAKLSSSTCQTGRSLLKSLIHFYLVPPIICYCLASILMTMVNKASNFILHLVTINTWHSHSSSCLEKSFPWIFCSYVFNPLCALAVWHLWRSLVSSRSEISTGKMQRPGFPSVSCWLAWYILVQKV